MINASKDFHTDAVVIRCNGCPEIINLSPDTEERARERAGRLGWTTEVRPRSVADFCPTCTAVLKPAPS